MKRGFELINEKGIIPTRATMGSAGYDFYLPKILPFFP
jgi:dUTPase